MTADIAPPLPEPDRPRPQARGFVSADLAEGLGIQLDEALAHHWGRVLRLEPDTPVALFNGRDGEWLGRLQSLPGKRLGVAVLQQLRPMLAVPDLTLAFAPLRSKEALGVLVEKATELGIHRLQPVVTRYTQGQRLNPERLTATLRDAAQQTERLDLPLLEAPVPLGEWLDRQPPDRPLLTAAEAGPARPLAASLDGLRPPLTLLVGPEGGFAQEELQRITRLPQTRAVSLGPRILRAETAALAALAVLQALIGDWDTARPASTFRRDPG